MSEIEPVIYLDKVKLASFDFDDTLAYHLDRDYIQHRKQGDKTAYYRKAFLSPKMFFTDVDKCMPSKDLMNLIHYLRLHDVPMYCVSWMNTSLHLEAKQHFVDRYYGCDIKVISASSAKHKVSVQDILCRIHNCNHNESLFIDDSEDVVTAMREANVTCLYTKDIKDMRVDVPFGDLFKPELLR